MIMYGRIHNIRLKEILDSFESMKQVQCGHVTHSWQGSIELQHLYVKSSIIIIYSLREYIKRMIYHY